MRCVLLAMLAACSFQGPPVESGATGTDALVRDTAIAPLPDVAASCLTVPVGACPANYVLVPNDCDYTANEFCLAKYEMKTSGAMAVSVAAGAPWGTITLTAAKAACVANGARYHLVTNDEWMATARAIEATTSNWSTTSTPFLAKGNTDGCGACPGPYCALPAGADSAPCTGTLGASCADRGSADFRFNRTQRLPSGDLIWDFSGNMFELIDHAPITNASEGTWPGLSVNASSGVSFAPPLADADYKSANLNDTDVSPRTTPDAPVQNIGIMYATSPTSSHYARGGDYCGFAGIYSVALLADSELKTNVGFRCAYK